MKRGLILSNTLVPPSWIIEEELKRENERKRKNAYQEPLPLNLPEHRDIPPEYYPDHKESPKDEPISTVVVIEL